MMVRQAFAAGQMDEVASQFEEALKNPKTTESNRVYFNAIVDVLRGSRDPALALDPALHYQQAVELTLLLEELASS